jgi:N-acetylglutamate synthase-like GNAT family acetyltransferase
MLIQKARAADFPQIRSLAAKFNLDYADMEEDDFWVAAQGRKIVGICGLKKHPDCLELCALGMASRYRNRGLGRKLVAALLEDSAGDIYLTTIIPGFFEKLGFESADRIPPSLVKQEEWCAGCRRDRCRVVVKKR